MASEKYFLIVAFLLVVQTGHLANGQQGKPHAWTRVTAQLLLHHSAAAKLE